MRRVELRFKHGASQFEARKKCQGREEDCKNGSHRVVELPGGGDSVVLERPRQQQGARSQGTGRVRELNPTCKSDKNTSEISVDIFP